MIGLSEYFGYLEYMQSSNPILSRYEKPEGFAYDEGRSAFAQASGSAPSAPSSAPASATSTTAPAPPAGGAGDFEMVTAAGGARMTINDVIVKTAMLFAITVIFAVVGWNVPGLMWVGLIGGLVLGMVNAFKKVPSPLLILLYGVFEGLFLGGISNLYSALADGIILQAVFATMVTFGVMLALYATGVIKVTKRFQSIMLVAVVSYLVIGIGSLVWGLLGGGGGLGIYGTGFGPIVAVIGVLIAAFFLLLDFEAISQGIKMGAPERESWRMAFGLTVTLIWLYLEFLRMIAIFGRD